MKYGCIGEHLTHSFSKEIHEALADYEYEIREIAREDLDAFMKKGDFYAINVTIPYKETVIPYLYFVDEYAKETGAVNTIVNREGRLYGYNTDFLGMTSLIARAKVKIEGKKVVILGTGGTSNTAIAISRALKAKEIIPVSRTARDGAATYGELYEKHSDAEVIINTTPVGMYPDIYSTPVKLEKFKNLTGVIDAVYNPLSTPLVLEAKKRGIAASGGLYMLVMQAALASEIFTGTKYPIEKIESVFNKIKLQKENIVLIGMPSSGKTTVGKILSKSLGRELIDTDELIVSRQKKSIPQIFSEDGEDSFRGLEANVIKEISSLTDVVISTGGGVVLNGSNIQALRENGKIYLIDRPIEALTPTEDRPLLSTEESIKKLYRERYQIYKESADVIISADCDAEAVAKKIERNFLG